MTQTLFDVAVWNEALEKFGAVAHLSVTLYGPEAQAILGPLPSAPLTAALEHRRDSLGMYAECAGSCLAQPPDGRSPVVVTRAGLAVVGVSLVLNGAIVGAVVAGYVLVAFPDSLAISRLARESGVPFDELWTVARNEQPVSPARLVLQAELLQVLSDTLLRENDLRRQSEDKAVVLGHLASHDTLTDLPNRLLVGEHLAHALSMAHRHHYRLAVLCLDIDRFKQINDVFGHAAGDELLNAVGRDLAACVRGSDIVGRQGGDEFIVVLSELAHADDAGQTAQKIITALQRPYLLTGHQLHITVSIGISLFPGDGEKAELLLTNADLALYHAKQQGRDGYRFFAPELNTAAEERQTIEAHLRRALSEQQFELDYQPKIDLKTGALIGAEALLRWRHPERGLLQPADFVQIAEDSGLIAPIGRWVLHEACRQARAWQDEGVPPFVVSVNVSAVEFRAKSFIDSVVKALAATGLDPGCLEIELTESVVMAHMDTTTIVLRALKEVGVRLTIDDFGIGWCSLSYLRHLPVDTLKIDPSFLHELTSSSAAAPIVTAMIALGKSLNLRIVADGVETAEQLAFLQAKECSAAQGFYFSQPLQPQQFLTFQKTVAPPY